MVSMHILFLHKKSRCPNKIPDFNLSRKQDNSVSFSAVKNIGVFAMHHVTGALNWANATCSRLHSSSLAEFLQECLLDDHVFNTEVPAVQSPVLLF